MFQVRKVLLVVVLLLVFLSASAAGAAALPDVKGHWAEDSIRELVATGAISGYPDGTYRPDHMITRAEFSSVLGGALGIKKASDTTYFDLVGHWGRERIEGLIREGIIDTGLYGLLYGPDEPIRREEIAMMTVRALGGEAGAVNIPFGDAGRISPGYRGYVAEAYKQGLIAGYTDNTFRPSGTATRAEAAVMVMRVLSTERTNILEDLNARVDSLLFFEGGTVLPSLEERVYESRFAREESRYIYWELGLTHAPPGHRMDFSLEAVYYQSDGTVFARDAGAFFVEPGWQDSYHAMGEGWQAPGQWPEDRYRVDLYSEGDVIATGYFDIYDEAVEDEAVEDGVVEDKLPPAITRLQTGELVAGEEPTPGRREKLTIENGYHYDAVVFVVPRHRTDQIIRAVYIRSGESFTLIDLSESQAEILFMIGHDWDVQENKFLTHKRYRRLDSIYNFSRYKYTITLHPVEGGTIGLEDLTEEGFPSL